SQLQMSTKQLLFAGVRRIDEISYFRAKLQSTDMVLQRRHPTPVQKLEARQERVLALVDGVRDLAALARLSHLGEFETPKILYQFLTSGFVEPKKQPAIQMQPMRVGDSLEDIYGKV